jgi:DNA uptake protein ComE-like DNA-binding protein
MNKYFDFSKGQLKFLTILSVVLVLLAGYRLIQAYAYHTEETLDLPVTFAVESGYRGVFTLDPNTAPVDSLELLPGIGPVLADRIVAVSSGEIVRRTN